MKTCWDWLLGLGIASVSCAFWANCAVAQITPDLTMGKESSTVTSNVLIRGTFSDRIDGGAIRGTNLFHSFEEFNINRGRGAYFSNPTGIENIFSRVTGDSPSNILGKLGVLGNANLFFINPNGILFGTNASLDVQGSFVGTTANSIQFGEQGFFSTTKAEVPSQLLTVNPSAFLFSQIPVGNIVNQSAFAPVRLFPWFIQGLQVPNGKNLTLLGGNVSIEGGQLQASGGRVEIGAVGGIGTVGLNANGSLSFPQVEQRADVSLVNRSMIDVSLKDAGNVAIYARNLKLSEFSQIVAGIDRNSGSVNSQAGDITLNAIDTIRVESGSSIVNNVNSNATGKGGNLNITTGSLLIVDNTSYLSTSTYGNGNAGNMMINARDRVSLDASNKLGLTVFSVVYPGGIGRSGNIEINTGSLSMTNGADLQSSTGGKGDAGNITINARDTVTVDNGSVIATRIIPGGEGKGGDINISTSSLFLTNAGQIDSSTFGQGDAGNITLNARDTIVFDGGVLLDENGGSPSGVFSSVEQAVGNGGNIKINTGSLFVTNSAQLQTEVENGRGNAGNIVINARDRVVFDGTSQRSAGGLFSPSAAFSGLIGKNTVGKGGNIEITSGSLSLSNNAQLITGTEGQGNAGNIIVRARDRVSLDNADIRSDVRPNGFGKSGSIQIEADSFLLSNNADLRANTGGKGDAGDIIVRTRDRVSLDNARIISGVSPNAVGKGGDIEIQTGSLSVTKGGEILTNTFGQGSAGNIRIQASNSIVFAGTSERDETIPSLASASVEQGAVGNAGNIEIVTPLLSLTDGAQLVSLVGGQGRAGDIRIQARQVSFAGTSKTGQRISSAFNSVIKGANNGIGGDIDITTDVLSLTNGAELNTSTYGRGNAGNIRIQARQVSFTGVGINDGNSGAFSRVLLSGDGNSGNIDVTTDELSLTDGGQISTSTLAKGNAGDIRIQARQVSLTGIGKDGERSGVYSSSESKSTGSGGDIKINTDVLSLSDGATLDASTYVGGDAGNIFLDIGDSLFVRSASIIRTATFEQGNAGNIEISTGSLSLTNGGLLAASTDGLGNAGDIIIQARNLVSLNGVSASGFSSGIFTNTTARAQGQGGNITISGDAFQVSNGAVIDASTSNAKLGGDIRIRANSLSLTNRGQISAQSQETGKAGNINISARETLSATNSDITTNAAESSGGEIRINARDIRLFGDSDIRTDVAIGQNQGGNITITADSIIAFDDSDILAFAGDGRGGDITLNTPAFFGSGYQPAQRGTNPQTLDGNNRVDVNATGAIASGNIRTPDDSSIQNNLSELPENPIDTNALIANSCIARSGKVENSFTITGTGGLPHRPGVASISFYSTGDVRNVDDGSASRPWQKGDPIVEPQGVYRLPSGHLVLSRECRE